MMGLINLQGFGRSKDGEMLCKCDLFRLFRGTFVSDFFDDWRAANF